MIDRITIGAACLMASLSRLTVIARMWPAPTGRAVVDECTPGFGVLEQALRWCPDCCRTESGVRNRDGWRCDWCSTQIPADGVELGDAA